MAEILGITQEEYFQIPALGSSILAAFAQSPDHALMEREAKQVFTLGHAFEDIVLWKVHGDLTPFEKRFFVADLGTPPDKIIQALEAGEDLAALEVLTKKDERDKRQANLHAWIDDCLNHPGRKPISQAEFEMLIRMADHLVGMELDGPAGDIIAACQWQTAISWQSNGIRKKALIDLVLHVGNEHYLFDLKTTASLTQFRRTLKDRYWIQALHYEEGSREVFGGTVYPMVFLVAEKALPNLAQPFRVAPDSWDDAEIKYLDLCRAFSEWDAEGRPARGWLPIEDVRLFFPS